jgi:hypothetical protein
VVCHSHAFLERLLLSLQRDFSICDPQVWWKMDQMAPVREQQALQNLEKVKSKLGAKVLVVRKLRTENTQIPPKIPNGSPPIQHCCNSSDPSDQENRQHVPESEKRELKTDPVVPPWSCPSANTPTSLPNYLKSKRAAVTPRPLKKQTPQELTLSLDQSSQLAPARTALTDTDPSGGSIG